MRRPHANAGFTLIELVVAITLTAIVLSFVSMFITMPVHMYGSQTRRAAMVDSADSVLRLMARDVRGALPNSVRVTSVGNVVALELLLTVDAARYRDDDALATPDEEFDFSGPDAKFTTFGHFRDIANGHYLAIYNVGIPGADAYELTNVITPPGTTIGIVSDAALNVDHVTLTPAMKFEYTSPERRVYLVRGPVTYLCDTNARTLRRYADYAIQTAQPTTVAQMMGGGATVGLVASNVTACNFNYVAGTPQRAGLATFDVTVSDADPTSTERVRLLHQVHVENVP
jgi:MSHA biogenesis protein MshO